VFIFLNLKKAGQEQNVFRLGSALLHLPTEFERRQEIMRGGEDHEKRSLVAHLVP